MGFENYLRLVICEYVDAEVILVLLQVGGVVYFVTCGSEVIYTCDHL